MNRLVVFSGLPGTDKSTLSKMYAEETGAIWLSIDPIEGAMKISGVENNYSLGVASYEIAKVIADQHIELGRSVIIDAVNPVEETRDIWRKLAAKHKTKLDFVECTTDDQDLHKERIDKRVRNIPGMEEITWERVQSRKAEYQLWTENRIVISTNKSLKEASKELLSKLK